jgi:hypothetical protein
MGVQMGYNYFDDKEWEKIKVWEKELEKDPATFYEITAENYILVWTNRDMGNDGLGILWGLICTCVEKGFPWVATKLAEVGYSNAFSNCNNRNYDLDEVMVWQHVVRFDGFLKNTHPYQVADFWSWAAAKWAKSEARKGEFHWQAGSLFEVAIRLEDAFGEYSDAYRCYKKTDLKFNALAAYAKANKISVILGKIDTLSIDFDLSIFAEDEILKCANVTTFLAGTDDVKDVIHQLNKELPRYGFKPIWFHKEFKIDKEDSMAECIKNVRLTDKFILILDKRYGLKSRNSEKSITENEFNEAYRLHKPIIIFIRQEVWDWSRIYHVQKRKKKRGFTKDEFTKLGIIGDINLYEFIDRIQHLRDNEGIRIPWVIPFTYADDILKSIVEKWGIGFT